MHGRGNAASGWHNGKSTERAWPMDSAWSLRPSRRKASSREEQAPFLPSEFSLWKLLQTLGSPRALVDDGNVEDDDGNFAKGSISCLPTC